MGTIFEMKKSMDSDALGNENLFVGSLIALQVSRKCMAETDCAPSVHHQCVQTHSAIQSL